MGKNLTDHVMASKNSAKNIHGSIQTGLEYLVILQVVMMLGMQYSNFRIFIK